MQATVGFKFWTQNELRAIVKDLPTRPPTRPATIPREFTVLPGAYDSGLPNLYQLLHTLVKCADAKS